MCGGLNHRRWEQQRLAPRGRVCCVISHLLAAFPSASMFRPPLTKESIPLAPPLFFQSKFTGLHCFVKRKNPSWPSECGTHSGQVWTTVCSSWSLTWPWRRWRLSLLGPATWTTCVAEKCRACSKFWSSGPQETTPLRCLCHGSAVDSGPVDQGRRKPARAASEVRR